MYCAQQNGSPRSVPHLGQHHERVEIVEFWLLLALEERLVAAEHLASVSQTEPRAGWISMLLLDWPRKQCSHLAPASAAVEHT